MNFNSPDYLFFLGIVLFCYWLLVNNKFSREIILLTASYYFYMSWNWKYAGLIAFSTIFDYLIGLRLEQAEGQRSRKLLITASLVSNLSLLGIFKYYNFFLETTESFLPLILPKHELLLPVGISFYTFQTLSYSIDIYRKNITAEKNFLKYAVFVSFFPQLVAGPIVRASEFLPQLADKTKTVISRGVTSAALFLIFSGLFKKVVLADLLASFGVDAVFENPANFSSFDLLFALYGYTFQIYNDFSGYTDIAIGSAMLLGFTLPVNFNRPYLALNLREFWTRWHISLSTWLRDYLYISLGGNRGSKAKTYRNLLITMLLGGLWHGAGLNFVFWGLWHGVLLCFFRNRATVEPQLWERIKGRIICFHLVAIGWLLFRVTSWDNFTEYLTSFGKLDFSNSQLHSYFFIILILTTTIHFSPKGIVTKAKELITSFPSFIQGAIYAGLILLFSAFSLEGPQFIYFQF